MDHANADVDDVAALVAHCETSLARAERGESKLPWDVLAMEGMTGRKTRHLYNNLCDMPTACTYLEVGCWKGSSTVAALHGNDRARGLVIDNFCEFGGPLSEFETNVSRFLRPGQVTLVNQDCWDYFSGAPTPTTDDDRFLVYMYDGGHTYDDHKRAITQAASRLKDVCVLVVDDWNEDAVRRGTHDGLAAIEARVPWSREIRTAHNGDAAGFWNGMAMFVVVKDTATGDLPTKTIPRGLRVGRRSARRPASWSAAPALGST